ncbi:MAG: SIR2 family protein [Polyangiaceae bacterium]|nr:SIR2 family protein [Polyangiaceae bacterium]
MDPAILSDLREAYDSERLILFVGAGVSAAAGLPTWPALAQRLLERVRGAGKDAATLEEIEQLIRSGQLIDALSAAKHALGEEEFNREVERAVTITGVELPSVLRAIAALRPKLWAVLTTNIDRLLERAFQGDWEDFEEPVGDLAQRHHYIWKLHGTLGKHRSWVFSREQYDSAMFGRPLLQRTFMALYMSHPILFVGFGLADDNIDVTLGRARALSEGQPPTHYALMPKSAVGPSRKTKLQAAGVRLLLYENADGKHAEVEEVLRGLAGRVAPRAVPAPPPAAIAPAAPPAAAAFAPPAPAPAAASAAPAPGVGPVRIFVSCVPEDRPLLDSLSAHLSQLERNMRIELWHEGKLLPGDEPERAIDEHLERAELILLLLSAGFLASGRKDEEVRRALARERAGGVQVIPILLRSCDWQDSPLHRKRPWPRALPREDPDNPTPVADRTSSEQDAAFAQIAKELRGIVDRLRPAGRAAR